MLHPCFFPLKCHYLKHVPYYSCSYMFLHCHPYFILQFYAIVFNNKGQAVNIALLYYNGSVDMT